MRKQLFVIDYDGTTLAHRWATAPVVVQTLRALSRQGAAIAVCTNHDASACQDYCRRVEATWVIAAKGAVVLTAAGQVMMTQTPANRVYAELARFSPTPVTLYDAYGDTTDSQSGLPLVAASLTPPPAQTWRQYHALRARFGRMFTFVIAPDDTIVLTPKHCSKGAALRFIVTTSTLVNHGNCAFFCSKAGP